MLLVMDYAPNGSLRQRYPKGKLVLLPQIVSFLKPVAAALQYAHDKKFIHRDVKPENMLIGQHQEVLLSDFGIATITQSTSSLSESAQSTSGTLAYMAPEQIEGHPRLASDQYALGVVVYEWLCGERPFEGSVSELIAQHLSMQPLPLRERIPTIPAEVEQLVLRALAKDPKARFASVTAFSAALEEASRRALSLTAQLASEQPALGPAAATGYDTVAVAPSQPVLPTETTPSADLPVGPLEPTVYPASSAQNGHDTPQSGAVAEAPKLDQVVAPTAAVMPAPLEPTMPVHPKARRVSRTTAGLLIGLVVVIIAGGILGSLSLLMHFGALGTRSGPITPARGGTWMEDVGVDPGSLIPNGDLYGTASAQMDQALYLPLFYGDAQAVIHPGAATEVPTIQNGGVNANATIWTFQLRPHLVWSDGQPYDARDVDFTWQLWRNPKFGAGSTLGLDLISSAEVSADYLSITFHLKRPFAPFLADLWVDGIFAPLPAHHFSTMAPEAIKKSPENLNPKVTSGPFMMAEIVPGDHYTLVRNPRYYRASEGLPYLDKVVFSDVQSQAGSFDASVTFIDIHNFQKDQRLKDYTLIYPPVQINFEALYFNFHNTVLASHREVRQAIAMAIDYQALIQGARHGFATPLCTDHGSFYHPGYEATAPCPVFDPAVANQLLDDNGWVRGPDGIRARGGQRLEFEYSTIVNTPWRVDGEVIIARNLKTIGIKLDIQNYPYDTFFGPFLTEGKPSPPTGAVAGRYDIAEFENSFWYDPDDSSLLACDQFPPKGYNIDFYCNSALDALHTQEQVTVDPGLRQQVFIQIHQLYLTEFPFITLYSPAENWMVRKGTHNYQPSPLAGNTFQIRRKEKKTRKDHF